MMLTCYLSVVLFISFGVIVWALMISCCSHARRRLSRRLRIVSNETTVNVRKSVFRSIKVFYYARFFVLIVTDVSAMLCKSFP